MKAATVIASLSLAFCGSVAAQNVIYVNGIQNTLDDFVLTKLRLQTILNESANHSGTTKRTFKLSGVWNPQGWSGEDGLFDGTLMKDKRRLFVLKAAEELYSDAFLNLLSPFDGNFAPDVPSARQVVSYLDTMLAGSTSIEADKSITEGNLRRTQFAANSIVANVQAKQPAVLIAHSQGNLLANLAYAKLVVNNGATVSKMLRVVNVANTSFFSVNGLNFTHASDAALYSAASGTGVPDLSLETMPLAERWTRTTPRCPSNGTCRILVGVAPFTLDEPHQRELGPDAVLDHGMVATYMSNNKVSVRDTQRVVFTAGATRFRDRLEDFVYTAANALDTCPSYVNVYNTVPIPEQSTSYKWLLPAPYNGGELNKSTNLKPFIWMRLEAEGGQYAPDFSTARAQVRMAVLDQTTYTTNPSLTFIGLNLEGWKGVASYSLVNGFNGGTFSIYPFYGSFYAGPGELIVSSIQQTCTTADNHAVFRVEGTFYGQFGLGMTTATVSDGKFAANLYACKSGYKPKFSYDSIFSCVL